MIFIFALLLIGFCGQIAIGQDYHYKIHGTVYCRDDESSIVATPREGIQVEVYDYDTISPNDLIGEAYTDEKGNFHISGTIDDNGPPEPFLIVYCHPRIKWIKSMYLIGGMSPLATMDPTSPYYRPPYTGPERINHRYCLYTDLEDQLVQIDTAVQQGKDGQNVVINEEDIVKANVGHECRNRGYWQELDGFWQNWG